MTTSTHPVVLIVEYEAALRRVLALSLQLAGLDVITAINAEEAANLISRSTFDLLIVSVDYPGGQDEQLIEQFRSPPSAKNAPILVIAGERMSSIWNQRFHPTKTIYKPYDIRHLCRVARQLVNLENETNTEPSRTGARYDRKSI